MADFFNRKIQIKVLSDKEEITIPQSIDEIKPIRITFSAEVTNNSANPFNSNITIYNLSKSTRSFIKDQGQSVELFAGYADNVSLIFTGKITRLLADEKKSLVNNQRVATDITTKITLADAIFNIHQIVFKRFYSGLASIRSIVSDIVGDVGFAIVGLNNIPDINFLNFAFDGRSSDALNQILNKTGVTWVIDRAIIIFSKEGERVNSNKVIINAGTGLLTASRTEGGGVRFKTLLNVNLSLSSTIELKSETISGEFKVISITHKGDNEQGEFSTQVEAINFLNL